MKVAFRIIIWICISLTIQIAGLFYANNYLFSADTSIKTKKVVKSDVKKEEIEIKIPENATNVSASFDAKFLAYYDGDVLKVVNSKTGEDEKVEFEKGTKVSFYKWLPDRNRMLIAEKNSEEDSSNIKLAYYDVDKNVKEDIKTIEASSKNAEVEDIQVSTNTNVICVKVTSGGKRSNVYWINIMKEMKKLSLQSYSLGRIRLLPYEDKLIYENSLKHKVYATGQESNLLEEISEPYLIAVDDNDKVYIGEGKDEKITKIYYGGVKESLSAFKAIELKTPADRNDIHVSSQGKIYINDNLKGSLIDIQSGKELSYPGNFVQIYTSGVISVSDGKVVKTLFN